MRNRSSTFPWWTVGFDVPMDPVRSEVLGLGIVGEWLGACRAICRMSTWQP